MLDKSNRLKKRKEFGYIYKNGEIKYSKNMKLYFISSKQKAVRIGLSVNNKVGHAVTRNKIKRQMRAILREFLPQILPKHNLIFMVKDSIINLSFEEIKSEIKYLLNKSNLLGETSANSENSKSEPCSKVEKSSEFLEG